MSSPISEIAETSLTLAAVASALVGWAYVVTHMADQLLVPIAA